MTLTKPQIEMLRSYAKRCASSAKNAELREVAEHKIYEHLIKNKKAGRAALAEAEKSKCG